MRWAAGSAMTSAALTAVLSAGCGGAWAADDCQTEKAALKARAEKLDPATLPAALGEAAGGDVRAQYAVGAALTTGKGVERNDAEAAKWLQRAAEQKFAPAQEVLGFMYATDRGVTIDYARAASWYRMAADQGCLTAMALLGEAYLRGRGVPQSDAEAAKLYRRAADQEFGPALMSLGFLYRNGQGVERNEAEGVRLYHRAAEQGVAAAMHNLGFLHYKGYGVPKDSVKAYAWFALATRRGDPDSPRWLRTLTTGFFPMSSAEVQRAQDEADAWMKSHPRAFSDPGLCAADPASPEFLCLR